MSVNDLSDADLLDELIEQATSMHDECDYCAEHGQKRYEELRAEVLHRLKMGARAARSLHAEYCTDIECRHE